MRAGHSIFAHASIAVLCALAARVSIVAQTAATTAGAHMDALHMPDAPEPAGAGSASLSSLAVATAGPVSSTGGNGSSNQPWDVAPAGTGHETPLSRVGIGANVSPLGIGINGTTVLSDYFDARLMGNFFNFQGGPFEIEGYRSIARLHLASMAASLDWYPFNSVFRFSPGLMFYNGNQFSATTTITGGTDFTLNGQTFYSASANAATGAVPLSLSGTLGLHPRPVAFTAAAGFGKFVPHSQRHWSFPSEFGVVFMGAPTADVTASGWVCLDQAQTQCSNAASSANPTGKEFAVALNTQLAKWRKDLSKVQVYPILSYSVVYSFNVR